MALLADIDASYTKTGKGTICRWVDTLSMVPFLRYAWPVFKKIPFVSSSFLAVVGYADTIVESAQWLFRGQFGSAATVAAAGFVGTTVNTVSDAATFWWGNAASKTLTGATLGTHARAATETVIGAVSGALGSKPQVLRSYQAGIGSIGSSAAPQGPGKFFSDAARSRGESKPDAAYARYVSGQADHITALEAARAQEGKSAYRGA